MVINGKPRDNPRRSNNGSDEYNYITAIIDVFGRDKMPDEFDNWTVEEKSDWIKRNSLKFFPNVPESLTNFSWAAYQQLHFDRPQDKLPQWLDIDKYRRGQEFVHKNYSAIFLSKILGLIYIYSFEDGVKAFIITGQNHTPCNIRKPRSVINVYAIFRNLKVIPRVMTWYDTEPWVKGTQAYTYMQIARAMHENLRRKLCKLSNEQIDAMTTIANPWCTDHELLLKDFAAACPFEKIGQRPYLIVKNLPCRPKGMNNADMSITQCVFIYLILVCPEIVGIHNASDEDIAALCHVWRCFGYFLGMDDEYNFCRGTLDEIRQRARDVFKYWIIPNLKDATPEWEHLTRCLAESLNYYPIVYFPFKTMVLLAADGFNFNMPNLYSSLSYAEWITYKVYKFIFRAMKFASIRSIVNKVILRIHNTGVNYNTEELEKLHQKSNKLLPDFSLNSTCDWKQND